MRADDVGPSGHRKFRGPYPGRRAAFAALALGFYDIWPHSGRVTAGSQDVLRPGKICVKTSLIGNCIQQHASHTSHYLRHSYQLSPSATARNTVTAGA